MNCGVWSMNARRPSLALVFCSAIICSAYAACPCANPASCNPLPIGPSKPELFVFSVTPKAWESYNQTYLTTIVPFYSLDEDPLLVCTAHEHGIKIALLATDFPLANLTSSSDRSNWVQLQVARMVAAGADGINVDIESPIATPDQPKLLTQLVSELNQALLAANPAAQTSFDVAWSPHDIDGRSYDFPGLAKVAILFVMGYDLRSQVWTGPCVAGANAGLPQVRLSPVCLPTSVCASPLSFTVSPCPCVRSRVVWTRIWSSRPAIVSSWVSRGTAGFTIASRWWTTCARSRKFRFVAAHAQTVRLHLPLAAVRVSQFVGLRLSVWVRVCDSRRK